MDVDVQVIVGKLSRRIAQLEVDLAVAQAANEALLERVPADPEGEAEQ